MNRKFTTDLKKDIDLYPKLGAAGMVSSLELPEVYGLTGTVLSVVLSLFASIFDKYCPRGTPYLYQVAALAGFGQLICGLMYIQMQTRVLLNLLYVVFSLVNGAGLLAWLLYKRGQVPKLLKYAYLSLVVLPSNLLVAALYSGLIQPAPLPFLVLPFQVLPTLFIILALGLVVGALATYSPGTITRVAVLKAKLNSKVTKR